MTLHEAFFRQKIRKIFGQINSVEKIENRKSKIQEDGPNPSFKDNCRPSAISSSVPRPSSGAWKLGAMPKMVMAASTLPVSFHGFDVVSKDNNGKGDRTLIHFVFPCQTVKIFTARCSTAQ